MYKMSVFNGIHDKSQGICLFTTVKYSNGFTIIMLKNICKNLL